MDYINKAASALNTGIDTGMAYLTENAFAIFVLLAIAYFIRTNGKNERRDMCVWNGMERDCWYHHPFAHIDSCVTIVAKNNSYLGGSSGGHVLASDTSAARNATSREEERRQVRRRQQELASERALQAAKLRREKELAEKDRKNHVAKKSDPKGDKLGGGGGTAKSSADACAYTPLQPLNSHSSGYRYVTLWQHDKCFLPSEERSTTHSFISKLFRPARRTTRRG